MSGIYKMATKVVAWSLPIASVMVASVSYAAFKPIELPPLPSDPPRASAQVYLAAPPSMSRMVGARIEPEAMVLEPMVVVARPPPRKDLDVKNWVCIRQNLVIGRLAKEVRAASDTFVWACEWRAPGRPLAQR